MLNESGITVGIQVMASTTHKANLDEGAMWPTAFALKELTAAEEARISALFVEFVCIEHFELVSLHQEFRKDQEIRARRR